MSTLKKTIWTYKDYYDLEDENRYEIIEGELIKLAPAPRAKHQIISMNLSIELGYYVKQRRLGRIIASPIDVIFDDHNVFQPDSIYISKANENIIQEKGIFGAPDLVVEILSPSTKSRDRDIKFKKYSEFGVKEYWIIDPDNEMIELYLLEESGFRLASNNKEVKMKNSKLFPDFAISFAYLIS